MMLFFRLLPVLLLVISSCLAGCNSPPKTYRPHQPGQTIDEKIIRDTIAAYMTAREARDVPSLRKVLHPSMDQLTSSGNWRRGEDAAVAGMQRSSSRNPGDRTLTVEHARLISSDVAIADCRYVIEMTDAPARKMWSTFVLVRSDAGWLITAIRNMKPAE